MKICGINQIFFAGRVHNSSYPEDSVLLHENKQFGKLYEGASP